jgi:ubiquinol-cytochrome c reductase cytochrome b subunit
VPEWYFLPFYAILRSIPDKLGGVLAMFGAIVVLFLIPFITSLKCVVLHLDPYIERPFGFLLLILSYLVGSGKKVVETPYIEIGQVATVIYFLFFLVVLPGLGILGF